MVFPKSKDFIFLSHKLFEKELLRILCIIDFRARSEKMMLGSQKKYSVAIKKAKRVTYKTILVQVAFQSVKRKQSARLYS